MLAPDRQHDERQPDVKEQPKAMADVRRFDPAQATERELADYYRLVLDTGKVDRPDEEPPPYESVVARLSTPLTSRGPSRIWAAYLGGRLIGMANLGFPDDENGHLVIGDIRVHPDQRRRGVGTALLRAALPTMRTEGRSILTAWGVTAGGAGAKWADALGFRVVHHDVLQMLSIRDTDGSVWQVAAPDGYRLTKWIGTAPDDLLDSYARARTAISDAPSEDSSRRLPEWTSERVRTAEDDLRRRGVEQRVVVAVHEATGAVAGLTELELHPNRQDLGYQQYTTVLAEHRGRGLGRVVKAAMVRWLVDERPQMTRIATSTAAGNVHMIRVNHQVGFKTMRSMVDVEAEVDVLATGLM
jgi:mycothiol synthase